MGRAAPPLHESVLHAPRPSKPSGLPHRTLLGVTWKRGAGAFGRCCGPATGTLARCRSSTAAGRQKSESSPRMVRPGAPAARTKLPSGAR